MAREKNRKINSSGKYICQICQKDCFNPQALKQHNLFKHPDLIMAPSSPAPATSSVTAPAATSPQDVNQLVNDAIAPLREQLQELQGQLQQLTDSSDRNSAENRERRKVIGKAIKTLSDRIEAQKPAPEPEKKKSSAFWPLNLDKM